ncbi:MAG TPA: helix-turn-helix domain-containing protein [Thermomicrobiales bacterium]|nr:helix-turn-helix domain-containing protein [Thermomicrobiales bacterium]
MTKSESSRPLFEILSQESYTPDELAELLSISPYQVRHSVRTGELKAATYEHHILCIRRADALAWLAQSPHLTQNVSPSPA